MCAVCKLNVHKRCAKNVANNCGINTKDMAKVLQELGISGDKFSTASKRKKAGCATLLLFAMYRVHLITNIIHGVSASVD